MRTHKNSAIEDLFGPLGFSKRSMLYACSVTLILLLSALQLAAQTTSTIEGTVRDKQGLAVAGAQVRATSSAMAVELTATTDAEGNYRITTLPPGIYEIKVSKDGFQSEVFKHIEVTLNRTLAFDINMQVGSLSQVVEVDSATPLLETSTSSTGTTITPPANRRHAHQRPQLPGSLAARARRFVESPGGSSG